MNEPMGMLYLVATPIGNLKDITLRALEILKMVDLVACEDTRRTGQLLASYHIKKPLVSYHEYNEDQRVPELMEKLRSGQSIALVTDGGTPLISDPGFPLVAACIREKIPVTSIPGPTACLPALQLSGLPTHHMFFLGFLPKRKGHREDRLRWIRSLLEAHFCSVVLYVSPHRLTQTLEEISTIVGNVQAALCRELTKMHEEVIRGSVEDLLSILKEHPRRGEMVLVLGTMRQKK